MYFTSTDHFIYFNFLEAILSSYKVHVPGRGGISDMLSWTIFLAKSEVELCSVASLLPIELQLSNNGL